MQPLVQVDPATLSSDPEVFVANHVYDYLVDVTAGNTIAPRLATEWKVSDDGLQYVFTLAPNATFHDGSPLTATDVVWTFDRLRNLDSGYPTASLYANIASIEATGDLKLPSHLRSPTHSSCST
jgi:peptide/nickel transport system substrate-binding protein